MEDARPAAAVLLAVKETLKLADAMNIVISPKHMKAASFLQGQAAVDPNDPEYQYHSNDIIDLCAKLLVDFKADKQTLDAEHDKAKKAKTAYQASLNKKMKANQAAIDARRGACGCGAAFSVPQGDLGKG